MKESLLIVSGNRPHRFFFVTILPAKERLAQMLLMRVDKTNMTMLAVQVPAIRFCSNTNILSVLLD